MSVLQGFVLPHPPVIVPGVGKGREKELAATAAAYEKAAAILARLQPDTLVIITPHSTVYQDYIHISPGETARGSLGRFGAPEPVEVGYDAELVAAVESLCAEENLPAGTLGGQEPELDHGVLVPLHFLRRACGRCKLVRVAPSGLPREEHYRFGMLLARAAETLGRRVVVAASGDLSHRLAEDGPYGYAPEGPELDRQLTGIFASGDFGALFELDEALCEKGGECGYRPALMLAGALDKKAVDAALLSYEGPFGVGYAVASFAVTGEAPRRDFLARQRQRAAGQAASRRAQESPFVRLARQTLEAYVRDGRLPPLPKGLPGALTGREAGVFVSLKKQGALRGCIGTIQPTTASIAQEIRRNAVAAGAEDPRFPPVGPEELAQLVYSVDVLSPPEPCDETMLDPAEYGVIVTSGHKRGLLLPKLDGVDTVRQQLEIAKNKAGIRPGEPCRLERFRVVRYE